MSFPVFAQSNKEDVDIIQSAFGKEKKDIVKDYMQVTLKKVPHSGSYMMNMKIKEKRLEENV